MLPKLKEIPSTRDMVDVFGGYNHQIRISTNEFYDMKNMCSDNYPTISPRKKRGIYRDGGNYSGLISKDAFCYVRGGSFFINDHEINEINMKLSEGQKQLVSMGAYVIILPDKKWVNTANHKWGNIDEQYDSPKGNEITFTLCDINGSDYITKPGVTPPDITDKMKEGKADIPYWVDMSATPHLLKKYSLTEEYWVAMPTTYVRIGCNGIDEKFELYDGVKIDGIENKELSDTISNAVIWEKGDNYIVVIGMVDGQYKQIEPITVSRKMPDMDFVIESGNRLWGCKYGMTKDGTQINEIYASKLGDFKNWNCFMGISTDSYAVSCGTDGNFTGAATHLGYPIFFKEHCLHKIYGDFPSNFQVQVTQCRGVEQGSDRSLAIVKEILFYKSRYGICAYDGSLPTEMSAIFGDERYHNAVAGEFRNKYYISMEDEKGQSHLFVFDSTKSMWHKEDSLKVNAFCAHKDDMYYISDGKIGTIHGTGTPEKDAVKWYVISGEMGLDSPDRKYVSRVNVRLSLERGSVARIYMQYDSADKWDYVGSVDGKRLGTLTLPIKPRRCDHFRLKIEGEGDVRIYSISKTTENGSDV